MLERLFLMVAPISAVFGAAVFVVSTIYLAIERCSGGCTGFLEGMNRSPGLSVTGRVIVGVMLVLLFAGRWGRGITVGFLAAFLLTAVSDFRSALFLWGISSSGTISLASASSSGSGILDRIHELQASGLDERTGGTLIYRVLDCIADMPPALPAEIPARNCQDLRVSWESYSGPERLTAEDPAWRWSYKKYDTGFQVAVYPDAMLGVTTPQFSSDQTGRTMVVRAGSPAIDYPRPQ